MFRVDDCNITVRAGGGPQLELALLHPEPHGLVLEFEDPGHLEAWKSALQLAAEWWTDNKPKREKLHSLSSKMLLTTP